ncbi:pre-rRNA processing [Microbotryomycetes sp. JL201]|nr:pre-rRNA processing [Microbotryomycetes sp. JL201]
MELGAEYTFTSATQFWSELEDVVAVSPLASLDELDFALRSYVDMISAYMDEYLSDPVDLDHALYALLESNLFTSHGDRMMSNTIALITPTIPSSKLIVVLMLILHLGQTNPLSSYAHKPVSVGGPKVFRLMRKRWSDVVPILMKWAWDAAVVRDAPMPGYAGTAEEAQRVVEHNVMPAEGWEERVGTAATAVLYEVCRVQKLSPDELAIFSFEFVAHLFMLVERTRDAVDETFNYTLIKLIIALNEQFMVTALPPPGQGDGGAHLPPPILPTIVGKRDKTRGHNLVLEVLREKEGESKTFCENIIFILNRGNNTPDSLCVSLLILKILYLLFTTAGTQEYFYTNDLCVLVDVFIRELNDLGDESEGLRHTYLRVLHPLLTNTQLRYYPYKRPQLRRLLRSLIADSHYRRCDPTTRRLVERNLRGSWCEGLGSDDSDCSASGPKDSLSSLLNSPPPPPQADLLRNRIHEGTASSLSIDAVAQAEDEALVRDPVRRKHGHPGHHGHTRRHRVHHNKASDGSPSISFNTSDDRSRASTGNASPLTNSVVLEPVAEGTVAEGTVAVLPSLQTTLPHLTAPTLSESPPTTPSSLSSSVELPATSTGRRRRPPPPPSDVPSRPHTPSVNAPGRDSPIHPPRSPAPGQRRPAPEPPSKSQAGRAGASTADVTGRLEGLKLYH